MGPATTVVYVGPPREVRPGEVTPSEYARSHAHCSGVFRRIYWRGKRLGKDAWIEMGWYCPHCQTVYVEKQA